jgi:hypothetical protein
LIIVPAGESPDLLGHVNRILKEERDIEFAAKPLETSRFEVEGIRLIGTHAGQRSSRG